MKSLAEYITETNKSSQYRHVVNMLLDRPGWTLKEAEKWLDSCTPDAIDRMYQTQLRCLGDPKFNPKKFKK